MKPYGISRLKKLHRLFTNPTLAVIPRNLAGLIQPRDHKRGQYDQRAVPVGIPSGYQMK